MFVCNQLGIDQVPRADQFELMIAAIPDLTSLKFEGSPVASGIDVKVCQDGVRVEL